MSKQDRQGVRTPADIERKYKLDVFNDAEKTNAKLSMQLNQLAQTLGQFMANTNAILDELIEEVLTYTITQSLTNVISDNSVASVRKGKSFTANITASEGYNISSITVTMGGIDITSSVVSGCTITIANVTGDIVITAIAEEIVSYTNLAEPNPSNTTDYTIWCTNARLNSSGNPQATDGYTLTNFVKICSGQTLRFKNFTIQRIGCYDDTKAALYSGTGGLDYLYNNGFIREHSTVDGVTTCKMFSSTSALAYIRLAGTLTGTADDVIITVDEEIV